MNKLTASARRRSRGRPRRENRRDIRDALLDAAELLIQRDGLSAVTERKIAMIAGVSESMIPYYFGDKSGLLFAVVDRFFAFIEDRLRLLADIEPASHGASREFARAIIDAYFTRPWIAHLMTAEQQRHRVSPKRYALRRSPDGLVPIRRALMRLAAARHGRVDEDERKATRVTLGLLGVTTSALSWYTLSERMSARFEATQQEPWLQQFANLIDFHCYLLVASDDEASPQAH